MEFPHLADTAFPHLSNVNVYAYKNDFDYTRWKVNTKVKLTNVLWNSDYNDVVKFETNDARDEWFDSIEDVYEINLTTAQALPPEGGIKLPIPFDVAARYNYLVVDIPVMTSSDNPIAYEDEEQGMRRWFFFVNEISSRAPNTTMFDISLDVWMQFANDIEINYMFLERGHAPVAATDVDEYLANPIDNNDFLLTPDVTPTQALNVASHKYIPFGNGDKYVCIATNVAPSDLSLLGSVTHDSSSYGYGNISYSDVDVRYGYQLQVNGFGAGNGDDYSNLDLPTSPVANNTIANNVFCYAITATEVYGTGSLFEDFQREAPVFMRNIMGCFVVDAAMINLGTTHTIAGHTVYEVSARQTTQNMQLTRADFEYPERYQRFAKLYTYPYAAIELTNNDGERVTVRIEDTGSIVAHLAPEIAFPFLNMRVFFTGINGTGSSSYQWKRLDGVTDDLQMPNSDWFEHCFDTEIPCYSIYMDGDLAWYVDNFNSAIKNGRNSALVAYHNAVRSANTARANAMDSNATMYANTDADATTYTTNTANSVNTNRANADITIASNSAKTAMANATSINVNTENREKQRLTTNAANLASSITAVEENETTAQTAFNNGVGGVAGNLLTAGTAGMLYQVGTSAVAAGGAGAAAGPAGAAAGLAVGALVGAVSSAVAWGTADANATAVTQANSAAVGATQRANAASLNAAINCNSGTTTILNTQRTYDTNQNNDVLDRHTTNTGNNMNANAANSAATSRANAARLQATGNANATYTREVSVLNAKESLENAQRSMQAQMDDAAFRGPVAIGDYAGNPMPDWYENRGVQFKVRTMPKAEVRAVGDWFARYGYALDQIWDVGESGLCPMEHFCYWKCRDVWVDDRKSSNNAAQTLITSMFQRGVTIWKNPNEIGRVNVYDN